VAGRRVPWGEEVIQKDIVHLYWGLSPWEGREAQLGTPVGEPLCRPKALGGGGQQKGGPVFVFSGLDCLEVPPLGGAGNFPHVRGVVLSSRSCCFVILPMVDRQVGGPLRFGVVGRPGYWCVFFEESYQTVQQF